MQALTAKEIACAEQGKVSYEIHWTIPNWKQVRQDVSLVKNQKAVFETGSQSSQMIQTKWLVGLKESLHVDFFNIPTCKVYWQLLDIKGSGPHLKLDAKMFTTLCNSGGTTDEDAEDEQNAEVGLGEIIEEDSGFPDIGANPRASDDVFINSNGAIEYKLVLTFKTPGIDSSSTRFKKLKMEQFSKRSRDQLHQNLAELLHEDSFSDGDLRIITRNGVELLGHQTILKVQCPVFAAMLNSNISETQTGIVKVDDLSGKTMKILLHYFYTGDLLEGWSDDDTIFEFTYAAEKYEVTQVLELLDEMLGREAKDQVSNLDVQLLNLCGKVSLKNAETRLLERVIGKVTAAKSGQDLFQLFGCDTEEISRKAEMLAGEQVRESKAFNILEYALSNNANFHEDFSESGLNVLAFVQRDGSLKALEQILLKRFAKITSKFTTAKELFAFFGDGK